jgi:polyisoprenoid-binding protein YceI
VTLLTFGPDEATCEVLTFREGVLSPIAHDLLLRATAFHIAVDPVAPAVSAEIDAGSLRVVTAMRDGRPLPGALRPADAKEIEATIAREVLRASRFSVVRFASAGASQTEAGYDVRGQLTLAGTTRDVSLLVRRDAGRLGTEVRLHQPDYGIRPYRAMLGALRVKPDVVVRVAIPSEGLP